jgi:hypothetical protein
MTRALAAVVFVGCSGVPGSTRSPPEPCNDHVPCEADLVCARNGLCVPPDQVRAVHVTWTVSGAPASPTSCAAAPDLVLVLRSGGGLHLEFTPVPCAEGEFSVDRLPTEYDSVELGRESDRAPPRAAFDAAGNAMLNLPY